jgi:hypothetical protein
VVIESQPHEARYLLVRPGLINVADELAAPPQPGDTTH